MEVILEFRLSQLFKGKSQVASNKMGQKFQCRHILLVSLCEEFMVKKWISPFTRSLVNDKKIYHFVEYDSTFKPSESYIISEAGLDYAWTV